MEQVAIQRNLAKFYLSIVPYICLAFLVMLMALSPNLQRENMPGMIFMGIMSVLLFVGSIYIAYRCTMHTPNIEADEFRIRFHGKTYLWTDVEVLALTGKQIFLGLNIFREREALFIKFNDGKVLTAFDSLYNNLWELKDFINRKGFERNLSTSTVILNKTETFQSSEIVTNVHVKNTSVEAAEPITGDFSKDQSPKINEILDNTDEYKKYSGVQLLCFEGVMPWAFLLLFIYLILDKPQNLHQSNLVIMGIIFVALFLGCSYFMNYFSLTPNSIIIRNQNFFWIYNEYELSDIQEVVVDSKGRLPNGLRVITKDYQSKMYYAAPLRSKTWRQLVSDFKKRGIKVRVEVYIDPL